MLEKIQREGAKNRKERRKGLDRPLRLSLLFLRAFALNPFVLRGLSAR
jgi:hypothetical protein